MTVIIFFLSVLFIDIYVFAGIRALIKSFRTRDKKLLHILYWVFSIVFYLGAVTLIFIAPERWNPVIRAVFMGYMVLNLVPKLNFLVFLIIDDLQRGVRIIVKAISRVADKGSSEEVQDKLIPRSEFLVKTGIVVAGLPFASIAYGLIKGAHDYQVKHVRLPLKNLPSQFHGLRIAQLSDIHSGSFYNKTAVQGGIEMLMNERPDLVFFTGDLVNDTADELHDYFDILKKVKAPLGVFSTMGNHDYGEYVAWPSQEAKRKNLEKLMGAHKEMGWQLLNNENRLLERGGDTLAIIGVENWGKGEHWPRYGRLDEAVIGAQEAAVKLLLSHDPSHWDAQIRPKFSDIDVTFSGHTHGFQFGVELGDIRWSPVQYVYEQWAGLYQRDDQFIYVNRGFGFIGFPGRIGIPPEITVFELVKA